MSTPFWCLLAFCGWTLALVVLGVGPSRFYAMFRGTLRLREIRADVPHGSDRYQRLMRAHMNCVENLPVFGSLVVMAEVLGFHTSTFDTLAVVTVCARVVQSTAHISSPRRPAVTVRFLSFVVQLICMVTMGVLLAKRGA